MAGRRNDKAIMISNADSIKKSQEFSMAKLNHGLTLNQMQLLAYAIYATQRDGSTTFIKADFEKKFEMEKYQTIHAQEDAQKLVSIQFSTEDLGNDKFRYWNVFQEIEYDKGTFNFKWTDRMLPHILDLKDKYVRTDLRVTSKFNSSYSWILYDYLKANYGYWYKTLSKDELLNLFGVENTKTYINYTGKFKQSVLDKAISEINEYTEINVKYEDVKEGRTIAGFKLIWSTGKVKHKASKKQMDILQSIADVVFEDAFMYMGIKDDIKRERALKIIRNLQETKSNYLDTDVGLTSDKCSELTKKASNDLEALNYLLEEEGKETLKPRVPMHDWLAEYRN
ncbi:replication initiation protein (plasmid) [Desemzia incerta]|uniref:replication initiation protein n=1 Tax=Desemzia incerta TaxID=82801 RepID=UPI0024C335DE|nr:replication initiation protein [Desemzia incerta]WHZ33225.1 replication initiation protein [Desemzia incerta]